MRKDSWIHAHFKSEQGAGDLTPEIARCLELETRDPALFWNTKTALLRRAINSVDELMAEADKVQKAYSEGASAQEIRAQFPLWYTPGG